MKQTQTLHVIGDESIPDDGLERAPALSTHHSRPPDVETVSLYDGADEVALSDYSDEYSFPRFVRAVCERLEGDVDVDAARVVDAMPDTMDIDFGLLLAFPDETLLFVGSDPTAKDSVPWFAFEIRPMEPVPTPETAQEAIDLLKPAPVRDIVHDEGWIPARHGEWWLLPTTMIPVGSVIEPGVAERPFGPSPLGNHIPRKYGFTVSDETFVDRFHDEFPRAPESIRAVPEVMRWTFKERLKEPAPDDGPTWADVQDIGGDVLVRGTIRHTDDDHFLQRLGDQWHRALTHDVEVYTGDQIATDIHLDYRGR